MKTLAILLAAAAPLAGAPNSSGTHLKATHEHSFVLPLAAAEAFTFFEPVGEKRWASGWDPRFATAGDARLHEGSVFTVDRPNPHGRPPTPSVWIVTRYIPPRSIEYHNVLIGQRTSHISIRLDAEAPQRTRVTVR